jgi:hypothetical protein
MAALDHARREEAIGAAIDRSTLEGVLSATAALERACGWYRIAQIELE